MSICITGYIDGIAIDTCIFVFYKKNVREDLTICFQSLYKITYVGQTGCDPKQKRYYRRSRQDSERGKAL